MQAIIGVRHMRIGIIGGGVMGRLFLKHIVAGELGDMQVVAIAGRNAQSKGVALAAEFKVPFTTGPEALFAQKPDVVIESAGHDAVREYGEAVLSRGISFIVLSGGVLADDALRARLEQAAAQNNALLYVPSGGIGGLDAVKAMCVAGVESVTIAVTKPAIAWKGIPYVEKMGFDMDRITGPTVLYEGPVRQGAGYFPANVNIAAVLSMAGIGFDRTTMTVVADPALRFNTHTINVKGKTGSISLKFESVPAPENPKTAWLACYSALAAIKELRSPVRYGT
jgi:aspartate dehydrogenase